MSVRPVRTNAELKRFIGFPYRLHRGDPMWVAPLRMDVSNLLNRKTNPFFQHGKAEYFLAERDGEVVGRIAAIRNDAHGAVHGRDPDLALLRAIDGVVEVLRVGGWHWACSLIFRSPSGRE